MAKGSVGFPGGISPLLEAIHARREPPIAPEVVQCWKAFPFSKLEKCAPVTNRYLGVFQDGEIKARGIALRRRDVNALAEALVGFADRRSIITSFRENIPWQTAVCVSNISMLYSANVK